MKTQIQSIAKDNVATGAVLAAMFIAIVGTFIDGSNADAEESHQPAMQRLEAITVTASREEIVRFDAIVVSTPRDADAQTRTN